MNKHGSDPTEGSCGAYIQVNMQLAYSVRTALTEELWDPRDPIQGEA